MRDALIYATNARYKNERRMTLAQCELLAGNDSMEHNIELHIEGQRGAYKLVQRVVHSPTQTQHITLIEAESTTAMYWAIVDFREVMQHVINHMNPYKRNR